MHGKTSMIEHDGRGLFAGLTEPFLASRYHSLIVSDEGFPKELEVTARTRDDHAIMGLRHRSLPVYGVQFHPESILTGEGRHILRNFLEGRPD
jgi:anthranilate synthase/aminodeoxychorismate synthase-like glutamine amidotransferase